MVLLEKIWDDVVAGPQPENGLGMFRKINTIPSFGGSPTTPGDASSPRDGSNVWRTIFNPGSNLATNNVGAEVFDKALPNSPTVYDWLYSDDTKTRHC